MSEGRRPRKFTSSYYFSGVDGPGFLRVRANMSSPPCSVYSPSHSQDSGPHFSGQRSPREYSLVVRDFIVAVELPDHLAQACIGSRCQRVRRCGGEWCQAATSQPCDSPVSPMCSTAGTWGQKGFSGEGLWVRACQVTVLPHSPAF